MKKLLLLTSALAIISAHTAMAAQISGEISFDGTVDFNTGDASTATVITDFVNERVSAGTQTGDYAGVANDAMVVYSAPVNFAAFVGPLNNLWSFSSGGLDYAFDLTSLAVVFQGPGFLALRGNGIARITGFDDTPGIWRFTAQQGEERFSFSASHVAVPSVPEGGSTVLLIGLALTAVGLMRRKLAS